MLFEYEVADLIVEVGKRARDTTNPVIATAGESILLELSAQELLRLWFQRRDRVEQRGRNLCVERAIACIRGEARLGDSGRDRSGRFTTSAQQQFIDTRTVYGHAQVETIEQGTRESAQISRARAVVALA